MSRLHSYNNNNHRKRGPAFEGQKEEDALGKDWREGWKECNHFATLKKIMLYRKSKTIFYIEK